MRCSRPPIPDSWVAALTCASLLLPLALAAAPTAGALPAPTAVADKVAFFDDFESGALDSEKWQLPTPWVVERARLDPWATPGLPTNDSNLYHVSDSAYPTPGTYANNSQTVLETTWIDLTEATAGAKLAIYHRFDIDATDDAAVVFIRSEDRDWSLIGPEGGYPAPNGFAGLTASFEVTAFDLAFFAGSRIKLAFQLQAGDNGVEGDGWQMDSVTVTFSTTVPAPDLRVSEVEVYNSTGNRIASGTAGDVLELRVNVTNIGSAPTSSSVPVYFFDGPPASGRLLGQGLLPSISPLAVASTGVRAVLTAGAHNVSAVVDPGRILNELSVANNEARSPLLLSPPAGVDLALLSVDFEVGGARVSGTRPGQVVTANFTVGNLGTQDLTGAFTYGVYLESGNATNELSHGSKTGLAAGVALPVSVTFLALAGNLSLLAAVDYGNTVNETNEGNNEQRSLFIVTNSPPADLTVTSVQALFQGTPTTEVAEGDLVVVNAFVKNTGTEEVVGSFTVGVFLGDPDAGGQQLFVRTPPTGLQVNASVQVHGTWVAQVGQRTIYAYADLGREIIESDELNNKAFASLHVHFDGRANLVITDVKFKVQGAQVNQTRVGAPVAVEVTVRNLGVNNSINAVVSMSPQSPWVSPLAPGVAKLALPAALSRNTDAVVTFTWNASAGVRVFFFIVDEEQATSETDEFDNFALRTLTVSAESPDLAVSAVSVKAGGLETSALYPGLNVTVAADVTNGGIAPVDVPFEVELWAGDPGTHGAVKLANKTVAAPFDPAEVAHVSVVWLASFAASGPALLVVVADPAAAVIESDRTNNRGEKDVTYSATTSPNLAVDAFRVLKGGQEVATATDGDALALEVTVKDDSPAPYLGGAVLEVRDGTGVVYTAPIERIEPGATVTFRTNWTARVGAKPTVVLDSLGAVTESNEGDNQQVASIQVAAVPASPLPLYLGVGAAVAVAAVAGLFFSKRRKREEEEPAPLAPAGPAAAPAARQGVPLQRPPPRQGPPPGAPPGAPPRGRPPPRPGAQGAPPPRPMQPGQPGLAQPQGRPVQGRPVQGRPMQGQPVQGRPPPRPGPPWQARPGAPPPQRPVQGRPPPPQGQPGPVRPRPQGPPPGQQRPPPGPPAPRGPPRPGPAGRPPPGAPPPQRRGPPPPGWRPGPPPGARPPPRGPPYPQRQGPPQAPPAAVAAAPAPLQGAPPPAATCPNCQAPLDPAWVICASCGTDLKTGALPGAPEPQPAPAGTSAAEASPPPPAPPTAQSAPAQAAPAEPSPAAAPARCPTCGDPTEAGWAVCPNCGTALQSPQ